MTHTHAKGQGQRMDRQMDGGMDEWMDACTEVRTDARMHACMNGGDCINSHANVFGALRYRGADRDAE